MQVDQERKLVQAGGSVRYIQGGSAAGGDGSSRKPWNSLAQAEAGSWIELKVLPSITIIVGSLTMKDGQVIVGVYEEQALFASVADDGVHDGDVFVANGNNKFRNLTITSAYRSGINAVNSKNLIVKHVIFNNTNTANLRFNYDYQDFSTLLELSLPFAAISYFGARQNVGGLQRLNTLDGVLKVRDAGFNGNRAGIQVGAGNSQAVNVVKKAGNRRYDIRTSTFNGTYAAADIRVFLATGGKVHGKIRQCSFDNNINANGQTAIHIGSDRTGIPNLTGRGDSQFGLNQVSQNLFKNNAGYDFLITLNGNETGHNSRFLIRDNYFRKTAPTITANNRVFLRGLPHNFGIIIGPAATGNTAILELKQNTFMSSNGRPSAMLFDFKGGPQKVLAEVQKNSVIGTTRGIDIRAEGDAARQPRSNGQIQISENSFTDNDSIMTIMGTVPFSDVQVRYEKNCADNTGARTGPPFPGVVSYFGGAIIFGGEGNPAAEQAGLTSRLGGIVLDLGGGTLSSVGHNNFLNTVGEHFWVQGGSTLLAKRNYFDGELVIVRGLGAVDSTRPLREGPYFCALRPQNHEDGRDWASLSGESFVYTRGSSSSFKESKLSEPSWSQPDPLSASSSSSSSSSRRK